MNKFVKIGLALTLLFGFSQAHAQWGKKIVGNGNVTTKTITTGDYDEIKAVGSIDVHIENGNEGTITVTTDENLQEYIIVELEGDRLKVRVKKGVNIKTKKGVHVTVPVQDISSLALVGSGDVDNKGVLKASSLDLSVTGSGDMDLNIDATTVDAQITGSGDMDVEGNTTNLELKITGSGDFAGASLNSENTEVTVSGSGDASVSATKSIKARVAGSGDIRYSGSPDKSDTKVSGSGTIRSM